MRRRDFIALLGGTVAPWSLHARAGQPAIPVIGFVSSSNVSPTGPFSTVMTSFRRGLNEGGYVEGRNVAIESRWAGGQVDRLPELVADLIYKQVSLIVASGGLVSAFAAKAATSTIPILFISGFDPVHVGLVGSLNHPGGNATGVTMYTTEMAQKRVEWLHWLVPRATTIAALVNPRAAVSKIEVEHLRGAARTFGLKFVVLEPNAESEFDMALAFAVQQGAGVLSVSADPFFTPRRAQIVALAEQYRLPTVYSWREYVEAGGLMSYGPTLTWAYREIGRYTSRILKGEKPGDLPVQMPTKFELAINLKTANALGLPIPRIVLASATEIIE
jgi:putative ABC transport system substrate-binding protein